MAQESSGGRVISRAELSDTVDQEKAERYLKDVAEAIEKLIPEYLQLSSWKIAPVGEMWSEAGRRVTQNSLTYAHGLKETKSSNYLDRFGPEGFYLNVRILSKRQLSLLSGASVGTIVFGRSVADGCAVATVMSANPKVPELEKKVTDIIRRGLGKQCD